MKKVFFFFALFVLAVTNVSAKGISTDYRNALIFAYSQANNVYEDDNLKLEIYNERLYATNKTSKTIFIDLAQCFQFHNGASKPLFDDSKNKMGDNKASKKGVSSKDDVYLTIAPQIGNKSKETFITFLTTALYGNYSTTESPSGDFTEYDKRLLSTIDEMINEAKDSKGKAYTNSVSRHLTEDESINSIGASIAYSFSKSSEEWNNIAISTWVSDVIFAPMWVDIPEELSKKEKRGFGVKETKPAEIHVKADSPFEFEEDRSPVIVCDWSGDFKKGTFTIGNTWVSKEKKPSLFSRIALGALTFGYSELLNAAVEWDKTYFKSVVKFDGKDADYGSMSLAPELSKTKQSK